MSTTSRRYRGLAGPRGLWSGWPRSSPEGATELPLPPERFRFMGESDEKFMAIGDHLAETLVRHGGLRPGHRVLDVGSGYGRLAHTFLRKGFEGNYLGLDVLKAHVRWCERNLCHPTLSFRRVDVHNERYNRKGKQRPGDLDLGRSEFDTIAVFSVFTHMWPEDVSAYLRLLSRRLATDGRIVATFFLFDEESQRTADSGEARVALSHWRSPFCRYQSEADPLHHVGYDLDWIREEAARSGLKLAFEPIYGTWSARETDPEKHPGYQDTLVFEPSEARTRRSSPKPTALEVDRVSKSFRLPIRRVDTLQERVVAGVRSQTEELKILSDVSFKVKRGEFMGIAGRNGSGKSTLLKIIAGIYQADAGRILMDGKLAPIIELGVGFNSELPALDNVVMNSVMMGLRPQLARERYEEILDFAELKRFEHLPLKNYSSGMRARLGFSIMVHVDADILLFDEVLAVGDAGFNEKCAATFAELRRTGRTGVLVTHSMGSLVKYCDRAILLEGGRIAQLGDPGEVAKEYAALTDAI